MSSGTRTAIWAGSVGVVLADSSIVTLALPEVLREYETSVFGVSWVLTAFNIVLAAAILPFARLALRRPLLSWQGGLIGFGLASLACALAPSIGWLIAARCVQAAGGAAVIAGAIELLARERGGHREGARSWGAAGTAGLALGPAVGGALTEAFSWESIFLLQAPVLLAAATGGAATPLRASEAGPVRRLEAAPEAGLALISAGLTGALFLLVILLTEGWGLSPLEAAAIVSAIPFATFAARRIALGGSGVALAAAGAVATGGGLAALGLLPAAEPALTIPPQLLIGAGLALSLPILTQRALAGADPEGRRAAGTVAARHFGIVVGIVALTPLLSGQLGAQNEAAQQSGTALLLDAPLPTETKLELGAAIGERIEAADGRLPDVAAAFGAVEAEPENRAELADLRAELTDEVERAATSAFTLPFLGAAAFALLGLLPIALTGRLEEGS